MKCLLIIALLIAPLEAYTWGVARTACDFFTPSHIGKNRRPQDGYYKLTSEKLMFSAGETIEIKVVGSNAGDDYDYTGILMSVRKDGESFGTWEESYDFQHVDCSRKIGSAIAEANQFPKKVGHDVFKWFAPEECKTNEMYYVKATVVKSKREFLDGLSLPLKCVLPPENQEDDSCTRKYYAIPSGATTSFEPNNPGTWTNSPHQKHKWILNNGSTPSPGTGPQKAYDGEYYMFMESSFPMRLRERVILISPPGLAGCLCIRFSYHMYTDLQAEFYCMVNNKPTQCQHPDFNSAGNGTVPMDTRRDRWINSWISINEPGGIEIKIIAQRGETFRGDIAVDNFLFSPGACKDDGKE